jgi:hypothetical protein
LRKENLPHSCMLSLGERTCYDFDHLLQCEDTRKTVCLASKALEVVAFDIFARNRWRSNNRLYFNSFKSFA